MRKLMEYKIISGRAVETKRSYMTVRQKGEPKQSRGLRVAGNTSERKIKANEISATRSLARTINANFQAGDGFVTLKYDDNHVPKTYEEAQEDLNKFLRIFRREYKKEHGHNPKMVWTTGNWSMKYNRAARPHHHMVVPADAIGLALSLWWGAGRNDAETLDNRGDHSDLAAYIVGNVRGRPGKKHWHVSRGMDKPIYTEPVEVDDIEGVQPEKGAVIREHSTTEDEDGRVTGVYLRCVLPEPPRVRGGQIYITRQKRGGRKEQRE